FFSSRRRHTRFSRDWSSDVCSSDLIPESKSFSTEFGSYSLTFTPEGQHLKVNRVITVNKGQYPKEKFADYIAFRKKTSSSDNTRSEERRVGKECRSGWASKNKRRER